MAVVRWSRSEALEPAVTPKVRWGRSEATVPATSVPKVRWGRSEATGAVSVTLAQLLHQTVEPLSTVTLTAVPAAGSAVPDSYVWRRVTGATVALSGVGATVTFPAPAHIDGTYVVIGVKGIKAGIESAEQQVRIDARPQLTWAATSTGWSPLAPAIAL